MVHGAAKSQTQLSNTFTFSQTGGRGHSGQNHRLEDFVGAGDTLTYPGKSRETAASHSYVPREESAVSSIFHISPLISITFTLSQGFQNQAFLVESGPGVGGGCMWFTSCVF